MKRYLLFGIYHYYPQGGLGDVQEQGDDLESVINLASKHDGFDKVYIFDCEKREIVWHFKDGVS